MVRFAASRPEDSERPWLCTSNARVPNFKLLHALHIEICVTGVRMVIVARHARYRGLVFNPELINRTRVPVVRNHILLRNAGNIHAAKTRSGEAAGHMGVSSYYTGGIKNKYIWA